MFFSAERALACFHRDLAYLEISTGLDSLYRNAEVYLAEYLSKSPSKNPFLRRS